MILWEGLPFKPLSGLCIVKSKHRRLEHESCRRSGIERAKVLDAHGRGCIDQGVAGDNGFAENTSCACSTGLQQNVAYPEQVFYDQGSEFAGKFLDLGACHIKVVIEFS